MKTFEINQALKLLKNGQKIRSITWANCDYISMNLEREIIVDNHYGQQCHIDDFKKCFDCYTTWEEFKQPLTTKEMFEALNAKKCISYEPNGECYYYLSDDCDNLFNEKYEGPFSFMDVFLKHPNWYLV